MGIEPVTAFYIASIVSMAAQGAQSYEQQRRASNERSDANLRAEQARRKESKILSENYKTNVQNWEDVNRQIDEAIGYYQDVAENPGEMSPEYQALRGQLSKTRRETTQSLQDTLRRAGYQGGEMAKIEQQVTEEAEGRLAEALSYISGQARQKVIEANLARPNRPLRGIPGQVQYTPFEVQPIDTSGFGRLAAAALYADQPDETKKLAESTAQRIGTVEPTAYDWYNSIGAFGPESYYNTPQIM